MSEPTDESRIRLNLSDYYSASTEYGHLMWRAQQAQERMRQALRNLEALSATAEIAEIKSYG